jgi:DivIVA domain-containing protein
MDLTPEAIREARFREAWRGYDRGEVDLFLDAVAVAADGPRADEKALAAAKETVAGLRAEAESLRGTVSELEARRDELRSTITALAVHLTAEQMRVRALLNELSARVDADLSIAVPPDGPMPDIDLEDLATAEANDAFFEDLRASIAADDGSGLFRKRRHG